MASDEPSKPLSEPPMDESNPQEVTLPKRRLSEQKALDIIRVSTTYEHNSADGQLAMPGLNDDVRTKRKPKFDGGNFTLEFLTSSPRGFEIKTSERLLRHEPNTPLPEARRIKIYRTIEPKNYRVGPGFAPKVGIRNPILRGTTLSFDIQPVTFPTYKAICDPSETPESLAISNPTGVACVLLTTESGSLHRIIVQHRSPKNFFYKDTPGASFAGFLEGKTDRSSSGRGRLLPIDTNAIKENGRKEMLEELGLLAEDILDLRVIGFAKDKVKIHNEILLFGISSLTAKEIAQKAQAAHKSDHEFDFDEKFFDIDGTHEAIETLLTQVKCPLPPTHAAAFVGAGFLMVLERFGLETANGWKNSLQEEVQKNYSAIDQIIAKYWRENPKVAKIHPDDKRSRNLSRYDPAYSPTEQGLPYLTNELERVELIKKPS